MAPPQSVTHAPILSRYKCRICGVFKPSEHYSNKELKDWQWKKSMNPSLNENTSRLRCRPCSGSQLHELQCAGPCGMMKELSHFSKASRTRGSQWCIECTLWKEAQEPEVTTGAAPNNPLAPDEQWMTGTIHVGGVAPEDDSGDEYDATTVATATVTATATENNSARVAFKGDEAREIGVPYKSLARLTLAAEPASASGSAPRQNTPRSHLRGIPGGSTSLTNEQSTSVAASSASGSQNSATTFTGADWSDVGTRRRAPMTFNAWGPNGQTARHVTSQPSSSSASGSVAPRATNSNWARPAGDCRAARPQAPQSARTVQRIPNYETESDDEP